MPAEDEMLGRIAESNRPTLTDDVTVALRGITEKRAATIANVVDELARIGLDETVVRRAIRRYGVENGRGFITSFDDPGDLQEFARRFVASLEAHVYEMETVESSPERFELHFHYCPYVNTWLRQGRSAAQLRLLCDACMEGDAEEATVFPGLRFDLDGTIARGDGRCVLVFSKTRTAAALDDA